MSITLSVELRRRVHWPDLAESVSETLTDLLAIPTKPAIVVDIGPLMAQDFPSALPGEPLKVSCHIDGEAEVVEILPLLEPVQTELPDGAWSIGEIAAAIVFSPGPDSALCWSLWLAVAIALARMADSPVREFSGRVFSGDEVPPEELLSALRCSSSEGLHHGARQVFAKLPYQRPCGGVVP